MTVRVDELSSEVVAEPEAQPAGVPAPESEEAWQLAERHRMLRERLARDAERTRAEAYGD